MVDRQAPIVNQMVEAPMQSELSAKPTEDSLDRVFHALANRTRRSLLAQLRRGPAHVEELERRLVDEQRQHALLHLGDGGAEMVL